MSLLLSAAALAIAVCPPPPARRETCVHDGDTVWIDREKIRLLEIDAPELDATDPDERRRAILARARLVALLDGEAVIIRRDGHDCFGRTLARIETAQGDVGQALLREGLAEAYRGERHPCG
ncbi:thermonuclease family protein [Citromicrobium bathyomarinum]|nr:thermonuclease family protein [Citromicrobium sp. JL2201]